MDIEFIRENIPFYVEAAFLTARIALPGILFSAGIGFVCCIIRELRISVLKQITAAYIELSRNTPLLVQLFFLYFGLPRIGIVLSSEACAIIGLAFLGGSYMAEAFRSGLEAVPKSQTESAMSLGMKRMQIFFRIILPQAVATSVPVFCANVIFLIKETSVFSAVALADLVFVAKDLIGISYRTDEALLMLVASYLVLLLPVSVLCSLIERRVRYAEFGNTGIVSGN